MSDAFGIESIILLSYLKSHNTLYRYSQVGGVISRKKVKERKKRGREGREEGKKKID